MRVARKSLSLNILDSGAIGERWNRGLVARFASRYLFMNAPANTPTDSPSPAGSCPLSSTAAHADSQSSRCCGSIVSASAGVKPKNPASKRSPSSM